MFYCGYDPGLEAYLATQGIDTPPAHAPSHLWAATALLTIATLSLISIGLL